MPDTLLSVGIDVGTSTTQVIFSTLLLQNRGSRFSAPDIQIAGTEVIYRGEVYETPLLDARRGNAQRIDAEALRRLVEGEFRRAGIAPEATNTGAVIITGESARKENAAAVLEQLSGLAGDFVVATAGPDLESRIAGQGSGAQAYSREHRCRTANFDIGGGTTNIAVFDCGQLCGVGCYDIGGRQLRFTQTGALIDISPSAQRIAQAIGLRLRISETPGMEDLRRLAGAMAKLLEDAIVPGAGNDLLRGVATKGSSVLSLDDPVDAVCFSGGVADCIYTSGRAPFAFGDFGVLLGEAVRARPFGKRVITPKETIRATVIGAGSYTTILSGSTVGYTDAALFPLKNLPVYACTAQQEEAMLSGEANDLAEQLRWFLQQMDAERAAISLQGKAAPGWQELKRLAQALTEAHAAAMPPAAPLIVLTKHDMGKALALAAKPHAQGRQVIALDGIDACAGDFYVDIGRPVMQGLAVPVVVKTLVFG